MKQSHLFTTTLKEAPKDEVSINAQLLERGGFIYKNSAGIYTQLPLGWRVIQKIARIIREEMNAIGGQEIFMPALHDKHYLQATGRWDVDVVFKVSEGAGKEPQFNISWTHEEIMSEIAARYVESYKNLPFSAYQIQTKFRNEPRAKSGLLRGREFMMKDLYSFHTDEEDLEKFYEVARQAYQKIFERCGLRAIYTMAAGGDFTTNYTHEFQVLSDVGEDTIYVCEKCNVAVNKEIIDEQSKCFQCGNTDLVEKKSIEVGNIFKYGTKYSEPFNLQFADEKGEKQYVYTGAYGIGLGRMMATIVETSHDDKGILWPESVAPFATHLISLCRDEKDKKQADALYHALLEKGEEVLYDDREGVSAGQKFADADLLGIPKRLVVSPKTLAEDRVEVKLRVETKAQLIKLRSLERS